MNDLLLSYRIDSAKRIEVIRIRTECYSNVIICIFSNTSVPQSWYALRYKYLMDRFSSVYRSRMRSSLPGTWAIRRRFNYKNVFELRTSDNRIKKRIVFHKYKWKFIFRMWYDEYYKFNNLYFLERFFHATFYRRKMCKIIEFKKRLKIDDDEIKN